jgi:hypothetical protein
MNKKSVMRSPGTRPPGVFGVANDSRLVNWARNFNALPPNHPLPLLDRQRGLVDTIRFLGERVARDGVGARP